jgi:ketosteroid isomerase-like protein
VAGELEAVASELMAAFASNDLDRVFELSGDDAQGVDEISRRWIRGRDELDRNLRQTLGAVSAIRSDLQDVHEHVWGDVGVLTCWLEQDYTFEGNSQHISAPTTIVLHREAEVWKAVLFHSIPLP